MKRYKGFTLIEVILAIALVGLIAIIFLPGMTNGVKWMIYTRTNITSETFSSQGEMEKNIISVKNSLQRNESLMESGEYKYGIIRKVDDVKLFMDEYKNQNRHYPSAYQLETSIDNKRRLTTLVADQRLHELKVPEIKAEDLKILRGTNIAAQRYEYYDSKDLNLLGIANMVSNPDSSFNKYRHDWYISKPGFIIPLDKNEINKDHDYGRIYPKFPDDFEAIPIHSQIGNDFTFINKNDRPININLLNSYVNKHPGRQIIYTIVPFSRALKKGIESESPAIYIYGPKLTNNLALHLDASTVDIYDEYHSRNNNLGAIEKEIIDEETAYYLRNWKNSRPNTVNINNNSRLVQTDRFKMPIFKKSLVNGVYSTPEIAFQGDEDNPSVWGRALASRDPAFMATMSLNSFTPGSKWTLFTIMRRIEDPDELRPSNAVTDDTSIFKSTPRSGKWAISWDENMNLVFSTGDRGVSMEEPINPNEWYLIAINVDGTSLTMKASNLTQGEDHVIEKTGIISTTNTDSLTINWNQMELAELLVYNTSLSSGDMDEVEEFLINKYKP